MPSPIRANKKKLPGPQFQIMSLPEEIIRDILARVSRWYYPTLSLVSKYFRSLVTSPELYSRRSLLGYTEHCLYVIGCHSVETSSANRLHILRRETNGATRLVLIPPLPAMPCSRGYVVVGSKIYVFGGTYIYKSPSAISIDCKSHTVQLLPDMPSPLLGAKAGLIDGKIYVIGSNGREMVMVVFDTETQIWELDVIKPDIELLQMSSANCVVMDDKLYIAADTGNSYVYEPKENKWTREEVLSNESLWWQNPCVVDDVLYCYRQSEELRGYDPKEKCWKAVNGVDKSLFGARVLMRLHTGNYGGKLALSYETSGERRDLWLVEIALTRREEGTIWGEVETIDRVDVTGDNFTSCKILAVEI